ncbi:MAG TPA: amidohydrolase family protein [Thermoanaerobaculia bacterium]|nr:amidohydrolase family protein [Thermoanaerobaculia bacterium]
MRSIRFVLALAFALPTLAQTVVFRNVNLIPMTSNKVVAKQTVVVNNGRIESILSGDAMVKLPEGTTIVDGSGKYLIPGLAEMHGHIPPPNAPNKLLSDVLAMYLANGVTTVRGMLGHDGQLQLREWAAKGEILSPNLYVAGPSFNGQSINSPQEAIDKVRLQKKEGWDLLKIHPGLTREEYDAMAKTAKEEGIRFAGHVPESVGLLHAIEMGHETFDHIDGYTEYLEAEKGPVDEKKLAAIVKKSKEAGVWIVPTSALWAVLFNGTPLETLKAYPELKYVPESAVNTWAKMYEARTRQIPAADAKNILANRTRILRALHQGGVKILMGTDAPQQFSVPGFSLHRELQFMRDAGMSPYDILKSGTANVGEYFAKQDSFGTIEKGKRADLVLLNANPLADIANVSKIEGVMVGGRWFSRKDLDERLLDIEAKYERRKAQ